MSRTRFFLLCAAVSITFGEALGAVKITTADVNPPSVTEAGHPRLLLSKEDLPKLQAKVQTEPFTTWVSLLGGRIENDRNKTFPNGTASANAYEKCKNYGCPYLGDAFDLAALRTVTGDSSKCVEAMWAVERALPPITKLGPDGGHYQCSHLDGPAWARRKIPLIYDMCADVWAKTNATFTRWVNENLFWGSLASSYALSPACKGLHGPNTPTALPPKNWPNCTMNYCDAMNMPANYWGAVPMGLLSCDGFEGLGVNSSNAIVWNALGLGAACDARFDPFNVSGSADAAGAVHGCPYDDLSAPTGCGCNRRVAGVANIAQWIRQQVGNGNGWGVQDTGGLAEMWAFVGPAMVSAGRLLGADVAADISGATASLVGMFRASIGTAYQPDWGTDPFVPDFDTLRERSASGMPDMVRAFGFAVAEGDDLSAMRWVYDRTYNATHPANANLYTLLWYPAHIAEKDPTAVWGNVWFDSRSGAVMLRNGYTQNFSTDVVAMTMARATPEWGQFTRGIGGTPQHPLITNSIRPPDVNDLRIGGLGGVWLHGPGPAAAAKAPWDPSGTGGTPGGFWADAWSGLFATAPTNDTYILAPANCKSGKVIRPLTEFADKNGGYSVISGSCLNVTNHTRRFVADYSGKSGVKAMFLVADSSADGSVWRQMLPCHYNITHDSATSFTITNPETGSSMRFTFLWPAGVRLVTSAVGTHHKASDTKYTWSGCLHQAAHGTALPRPVVAAEGAAGDWLVAMTIATAGEQHPEVTTHGTGCCNQRVSAGSASFAINGDTVAPQL